MQMDGTKSGGAIERAEWLISQGCGSSEIRRGSEKGGRAAIGAPSSRKSWKRIGSGCRDRESDKRVSTQPEHEHMQPLRYFMDNRSRPLIKPNITSEGLSKLLREMN